MSPLLKAFMTHERGIKRYLRKFSLGAGAEEDLTQETFLRAFAAEGDGEITSHKAFLYRIARNLALNERAKHSSLRTDRIEDVGGEAAFVEEREVTAEVGLYGRQKMMAFAEAVSALPPQCRRVFILRKVHGLSQLEVAAELGISASTVEKHVALGLAKCAEYMRQRGHAVGRGDGAVGAALGPDPAVADRTARFPRRGASGDV
ncbi:MAG: RNA polymerase sigma factor [Phenylobacterium zucineum]|nr:MAG: RNA polymerase sigma factor [Phenylobacterium zucineum]